MFLRMFYHCLLNLEICWQLRHHVISCEVVVAFHYLRHKGPPFELVGFPAPKTNHAPIEGCASLGIDHFNRKTHRVLSLNCSYFLWNFMACETCMIVGRPIYPLSGRPKKIGCWRNPDSWILYSISIISPCW